MIFALLFVTTTERAGSRAVKQQVVEKEIALLIDSAEPGMSFEISKINIKGVVDKIEIKDGKVYSYVNGMSLSKGYEYFTKYNIELKETDSSFIINVK
jgi:hypothetical protein